MIVRERQNEFVMIEQDNHAHLSGEIITQWNDSLFPGKNQRNSVEYAIYNHDYGWKPIDNQPFWNDEQQAPYSFTDFPNPPKLVFYKHGIDEVEKVDSYAALLCSRHYSRFLLDDTLQESQEFVQQEKKRQQQIIHRSPEFNSDHYDFHYSLLQLCDNLSLFICLNEPGIANEDGHPFFKDGIPIPSALNFFEQGNVQLHWKDEQTIGMSAFPFTTPLTVSLKQKNVSKEAITEKGLAKSYTEVPFQQTMIHLVNI